MKKSKKGEELTPCNYKGGQKFKKNQRPLAVCVDWFECSFISPLIVDGEKDMKIIRFGDEIILQKEGGAKENGIKHFKHCYQVLLNGEPFLQISTSPRASIMDANLSTIKVENFWLYRRGWITCLGYVLEELNATLKNITRLDICVDGGLFLNDFSKLLNRKYLKLGKAGISAIYNSDCSIQGGYIGSKASNKFCKVYDKTLELKKGNMIKPYIPEFWAKNGISSKDRVERLEITLKGKAIKSIKDFDWTRLEDSKYLAGCMKSQIQKLYTLIPATGSPNHSRRKKIQVCDWAYFDTVEIERLPKTNKPSVIWRAKNWVTHEMQRSFAGLDKIGNNLWDNAFNRCLEECKKYGMLDWFEKNLTKWQNDKEIHELMKKKIREVKRHNLNYNDFHNQQFPT